MMTNAERQRKFREAKKANGLISVTAMIPQDQQSEVAVLLRALAENRDLELMNGSLRSKSTGRIVKL